MATRTAPQRADHLRNDDTVSSSFSRDGGDEAFPRCIRVAKTRSDEWDWGGGDDTGDSAHPCPPPSTSPDTTDIAAIEGIFPSARERQAVRPDHHAAKTTTAAIAVRGREATLRCGRELPLTR